LPNQHIDDSFFSAMCGSIRESSVRDSNIRDHPSPSTYRLTNQSSDRSIHQSPTRGFTTDNPDRSGTASVYRSARQSAHQSSSSFDDANRQPYPPHSPSSSPVKHLVPLLPLPSENPTSPLPHRRSAKGVVLALYPGLG
jgi:hypothetical protein